MLEQFSLETAATGISLSLSECQNLKCRRPRADFPMAFRQDPYCSDNCRKAIGMDLPK